LNPRQDFVPDIRGNHHGLGAFALAAPGETAGVENCRAKNGFKSSFLRFRLAKLQ